MNRRAGIATLNRGIFKTYDIRGRYPHELDERAAEVIGERIGRRIFPNRKIVIAHDARTSSPALYRAFGEGLIRAGAGERLVSVGFASTPMLYFLVNRLRAGGGIMVTASHNPKEWNGLKVVGKHAAIISGHELYRRIR